MTEILSSNVVFCRCGPYLADLVGVRSRDPHLLVDLTLHVVQYCTSSDNQKNLSRSHPYCTMQYVKTPFPTSKCLFHYNSCFGVRIIVSFLSFVLCCCIRRYQEKARCVTSIPKKNSIVEATMSSLQILLILHT